MQSRFPGRTLSGGKTQPHAKSAQCIEIIPDLKPHHKIDDTEVGMSLKKGALYLSIGVGMSAMLVHAADVPIVYRIKQGDSLSQIANQIARPGQHVYRGRDGGVLAQILRLNPQLKNAHHLLPGETVLLPGESGITGECQVAQIPPSPVRTPAQQESVNVPVANDQKGYFSLRPNYYTTSLRAKQIGNDAMALLVSQSHSGARLAYGQQWSDDVTTEFYFAIHELSIKPLGSGSTGLSGGSPTLKDFGARGIFRLSDTFALGGGISFTERPFVQGASSTSIAIDPLAVPSVNAFGAYDVYTRGRFTTGLRLGVGLDFPTPASQNAYKTKLNPSVTSAFFVRQNLAHGLQAEAGLMANWTRENTTLVNQAQIDLGISLGIAMPFGGDEEQGAK